MTAYLKTKHPLEFAAANLRHAKNEDAAILLLREMDAEGIEYIPFDIDLSEKNWQAKDGKLVGGFMNLYGVGESKASKYIQKRNDGALTKKEIETLAKAHNPFKDVFPFHKYYEGIYTDPRKYGIADKVWEISEINNHEGKIPHKGQYVFMGELIYKNPRDANEEVNVKKRGGQRIPDNQPKDYLDIRLRDDHSMIGGRIDRWRFARIGKEMLEHVPSGSHILVRAAFFNDIRFAFITKWKRIDNDEKFRRQK